MTLHRFNMKSSKPILIIGALLLSSICQAAYEIENATYELSLSETTSSFTLKRKGMKAGATQKGALSQEIVSVKKYSLDESQFGSGWVLECTGKDGSSTRLALYDSVPFLVLQQSIHNKTSKQISIDEAPLVSLDIDLDRPNSELVTRGTDGLQKLDKDYASYVFGAIADPDTGGGVVSAWVSSDRGSGIVNIGQEQGTARLKSFVTYGDLRLDPGQTEKGEVLMVGFFDDIRVGLEQFSHQVKDYYDIKLRELPTVYCTWYHANDSSAERIAENADFVEKNLKQYGLSVMQIDSKWQAGDERNGPKKVFEYVDPEGNYPNGMKPTADYMKEKGLVPGIWFIPFAGTFTHPYFADKQDLFYKVGKGNPNKTKQLAEEFDFKIDDITQAPYVATWGGTTIDMTYPKSQEYLRTMVKRMAHDWGYEYFKMDGLWTGLGSGLRYHQATYRGDDVGKTIRHNPMITPVEAYRMGLDIVREAAGDDVFFLGCCMIQELRTFGASFGKMDAMRVGPDNGIDAARMLRGPQFTTRYYFLDKKVWYNDPDPMYFRPRFPYDQAKLLATWVTLNGGLNASSEDYYKLPEDRLHLLRRTMPSHASLNSRPLDFLEHDISHEWLLQDDASGVSRIVIGHYNWDGEAPKTIETRMDEIGLDPSQQYMGFDYWSDAFITPFSGSIQSGLSPYGCRNISIYPVKSYPQLVSTNRHITQGIVDVKKEEWTEPQLKLVCDVVGNETYELRVVVPSGASWILDSAVLDNAPKGTKTSFTQEGPHIRVKVDSPINGEIQLALNFKPGQVAEAKPVEIVEFSVLRDFEKAIFTWETTGFGSGFKLIRNDGRTVYINGDEFTDFDLQLENSYTYQLEALGNDGDVLQTKSVKLSPMSLDLPPLPAKPGVSITSLEPVGEIENGWRDARKNSAVSGKRLTIDGVEYDDGYGVHAPSTMRFKIPKGAKRFVAVVGPDAGAKEPEKTSVRYRVFGDVVEMGEDISLMAQSPVLKNSGIPKWHFDVELDERYKEIVLIVDDGGDGKGQDHTNWCDAGFIFE